MYRRALIYAIAALLGIALAVASAGGFALVTVRGSGMEPCLKDGDVVLVNRLAKNYEAGDLVAFENEVYGENGEGRVLVRRVKMCTETGRLFLICDNEASAMDSRNDAIGLVDVQSCIGRVCIW